MPTSLLEIVDLGDGEIVLRRAEESADLTEDQHDRAEHEPLVTIRFSEESRLYIMDQSLEVAKAMIQAGIQAAAMVAEQAEVEVEAEPTSTASTPRVLH